MIDGERLLDWLFPVVLIEIFVSETIPESRKMNLDTERCKYVA